MLVRLPAACRRWWPSPALQALPYLLHPPRPAPADPQRGGGSRRSLLLPRERAGRRERSASPPVWAPPWAARLAGCASPLEAPARCALVPVFLALGAPALALAGLHPRATPPRSCPLLCGGCRCGAPQTPFQWARNPASSLGRGCPVS